MSRLITQIVDSPIRLERTYIPNNAKQLKSLRNKLTTGLLINLGDVMSRTPGHHRTRNGHRLSEMIEFMLAQHMPTYNE